MRSLSKPLLIYDGGCNFCKHQVRVWRYLTDPEVDYEPYQEAGSDFPEIPPERFDSSIQLVVPTGEVFEGAEAMFRTLAHHPHLQIFFWFYQNFPLFRKASEWGYRLVAENRHLISRISKKCWGTSFQTSTYWDVRSLFLRGLGLVYATAFFSLALQITGLVGEHGILPLGENLSSISSKTGIERYWDFPTLFWLNHSDIALQSVCYLGIVLSLAVLLGVTTAPVLAVLWISYLSLVTAGADFLMFQWNTLLLETGFLAMLWASFRIHPFKKGAESPPSLLVIWMIRWLLFRLMWFSGVVKLASGDPSWSHLNALKVHFETQPLPTWVGWYVHQLPEWVHSLSVFMMFGVELLVPFLIFGDRRLRCLAFFVFTGFQVLVLLTGNYGFFNGLSILLGVVLLDDAYLSKIMPASWRQGDKIHKRIIDPWLKPVLISGTFGMVLYMSTLQFFYLGGSIEVLPKWVVTPAHILEHLKVVNRYGLFAVMTQKRREIILEGSDDGKNWKEYPFAWKPGEVTQAPQFVAPYQPRLDWQMWFASLGDYRQNPWVMNLMVRLLEGRSEVESLLGTNPFPDKPPLFMRTLVYEYHFTDWKTRQETGAWWRRELKGAYTPYLKLPGTPSPGNQE